VLPRMAPLRAALDVLSLAWELSIISAIYGIQGYMYTKAAVRATSATSLPMWGVEGSGIVP
jgi:hypothetical protein